MARLLGVMSCALLLSLLLAKSSPGQQISNQLPHASIGGQTDSATIGSSGTIRSQPADERTLVIAPQPGDQPPTHSEIVAERVFRPSEDEASLDRNSRLDPGAHEGQARTWAHDRRNEQVLSGNEDMGSRYCR